MSINWRASSLHAAVVGLANSAIQLVSAFGVHLTSDQNVAITGITNSLLLVLSVLLISNTTEPSASPPVVVAAPIDPGPLA